MIDDRSRTQAKRTSGGTLILFAMVLAIAVTASADADSQTTTVIAVRHAEKVDDSADPPLSAAGEGRARALVEVLESSPPDAIYASQYRRTQDTVAPAARRFGLEVRIDPVERPIRDWARRFAAELIERHAGETVLIAGHSNTVPDLVAALCQCEVEALEDSDYDRLFVVQRPDGSASQPSGPPTLITARFGQPSPSGNL